MPLKQSNMRCKPRDAAAIVVAFHPGVSIIRNVCGLAEQLRTVYVMDNSPGHRSQRIFRELTRFPQVRLIHLGVNIGIGGALNIGMQHAKADGFLWAYTFDQDSFLARGAAHRIYRATHRDSVALVAPLIRDAGSQSPMLRKEDEWLAHDRQIVITSGNLVRIAAWDSVGGFDWQLFLDGVDFDFCLRLAKKGWLIERNAETHLRHRLGRQRSIRLFGLVPWTVRYYPPLRRYFQARNAITVVRRHAGFAPMWSLEHLVKSASLWLKIILIERASRGAWIAGLKAGLVKRDYQVSAIQPFASSTRPTALGLWKNSAQRLARTYRKRLDELSTFPPA